MGGQQSRARSGTRSESNDKAIKSATAAAFLAIDARNVKKLRTALSVGAAIGNVRPPSSSGRGRGIGGTTRTASMSLIEYAVDKNYFPGIDAMLKVRFHLLVHLTLQTIAVFSSSLVRVTLILYLVAILLCFFISTAERRRLCNGFHLSVCLSVC